MNPEELKALVKDAVKEAQEEHPCFLTSDEKAIVKDIVDAGKVVKKTIIGGLAMAILYLIIKGVAMVRGLTGL